ncbi:hypothetical protein GUJ93_ZPchr0911g33364 [Zizania palustris]|uniref:Uncharacterized protein n=1 Tax=Zizania palustris TaxID=103762 RepID=A0A8J5QTG3_ZIZPA|nr:hypothetical protein GUJ93_ZPchr0911g33364 [Zizania palustris]
MAVGGSLKKSLNDLAIPRRPTMHRETFEHQNPQNINDQHHEQNMEEPSPPLQPLRHSGHHSSATEFDFIYPPSPMGRGLIHSTAGGVLGGMAVAVLPWAFRGHIPPNMYYTSPHYVSGPQYELQAEETAD